MIRCCLPLVLLFGSVSTANAGFVGVFSNDGSGGVTATFSGTGTFLNDGPNASLAFIDIGNIFEGPTTDNVFADSFSGSFTVDGNTINVTSIDIDEDGSPTGDDVTFNYTGSITTTPPDGVYAFDLTATWDSTTLAFAALNPGVYGPGTQTDTPEFNSVEFRVVPEPSSFAFILLAIAGMRHRRRHG